MKSVTFFTQNWRRIDSVNAATADSLQNLDSGSEIIIDRCCVGIDSTVESDGEKECVVFGTPNMDYYSSISSTVIQQCDDIVELLNTEMDTLTLRICKSLSKGKEREYIQLRIVDYTPKER